MYPLVSVFIIVVGALLLVFANKIIKNNKVNRIGIKVVGGILIIVGLLQDTLTVLNRPGHGVARMTAVVAGQGYGFRPLISLGRKQADHAV